VVAGLFLWQPPRRAILVSFVMGLLLLPGWVEFNIRGLPDYNKTSAIVIPTTLAAFLFIAGWWKKLRVRWFDIPVIAWCLCPLLTAFATEQPMWDGISTTISQVLYFGLPYVLGRLFFDDRESLRDLAVVVLVGTLLYLPLCWYELRMSPTLLRDVYGLSPAVHHGGNIYRSGGYRPAVFLASPVMLGIWLMYGTLIASGLWWSSAMKVLSRVPIWSLWALLVITLILCKVKASYVMLPVGMFVLLSARHVPTRAVFLCLVLISPTYMLSRHALGLSSENVLELVDLIADSRDLDSLQTRLTSEDLLVARTMSHSPLFGMGRGDQAFGDERTREKFFILSDGQKTRVIPDALWVITISKYGLFGIITFTTAVLLPGIFWLVRVSPTKWMTTEVGPVFTVLVCLMMVQWNNLINAHLPPPFILALGGLTSFVMIRSGGPNVAAQDEEDSITDSDDQEDDSSSDSTEECDAQPLT